MTALGKYRTCVCLRHDLNGVVMEPGKRAAYKHFWKPINERMEVVLISTQETEPPSMLINCSQKELLVIRFV